MRVIYALHNLLITALVSHKCRSYELSRAIMKTVALSDALHLHASFSFHRETPWTLSSTHRAIHGGFPSWPIVYHARPLRIILRRRNIGRTGVAVRVAKSNQLLSIISGTASFRDATRDALALRSCLPVPLCRFIYLFFSRSFISGMISESTRRGTRLLLRLHFVGVYVTRYALYNAS